MNEGIHPIVGASVPVLQVGRWRLRHRSDLPQVSPAASDRLGVSCSPGIHSPTLGDEVQAYPVPPSHLQGTQECAGCRPSGHYPESEGPRAAVPATSPGPSSPDLCPGKAPPRAGLGKPGAQENPRVSEPGPRDLVSIPTCLQFTHPARERVCVPVPGLPVPGSCRKSPRLLDSLPSWSSPRPAWRS